MDAVLFLVSWRAGQASWHRKWWSDATGNMTWSGSTGAEVVDGGDGDRSLRSTCACLGGSWWRDEAQCERRGRGEDGSDGARRRSGVSSGVSMPILARLDVTRHVLARALLCSS
jgi:hypothetical protein